VNDSESSEGAKIFTLFHEYCHLLLRQAGISDENDSNRIEQFCNQFAASFLTPKSAIAESVAGFALPHEFSDTEVKRLATRFRVSNRAIALRLERTGLAPRGFYARRTAPWDVPEPSDEPKPIPEGRQPSYIRIQIKKKGRLHAETILHAVERRAINSFDAAELMGLKYSSFGKLKAVLG
jgi:Zn-dependent peptidase ImmA (M78 family)